MKAIASESEHYQPGLNFLLAQIYDEQGDVIDATGQIRHFLQFNNSRQTKKLRNRT